MGKKNNKKRNSVSQNDPAQDQEVKDASEAGQLGEEVVMIPQEIKEQQNTGKEEFWDLYLCDVDVISAKELPKADLMGKCDGFVEVKVAGLTRTTEVVKNEYNPTWNAHFSFHTLEYPKEIRFQVFDWDSNSQNDDLGFAVYQTDELFKTGKPFEGYLKVEKTKKTELQVKISCRILRPVETEKQLAAVNAQFGVLKRDYEEQRAMRISTIESLNKQIEQLTSEKDKLNDSLNQAKTRENTQLATIANLNSQISEKDQQIANLKAEKEKEIANLNSQISEKEKQISNLQSEKEKELANLNSQISDMKVKVEDHHHLEQEHQEVKKRLEKELQNGEEQRHKIQDLQSEVNDLQGQIAEEKRQMEEQEALLAEEKKKNQGCCIVQ